jgi:hypothetical protein
MTIIHVPVLTDREYNAVALAVRDLEIFDEDFKNDTIEVKQWLNQHISVKTNHPEEKRIAKRLTEVVKEAVNLLNLSRLRF